MTLANTTHKDLVQRAVTAIFRTFDAAAAEPLLAEDYTQHNPGVPTGRAPLLGVIPALENSGIQVTTHRMIAEGDFVVMHNTYDQAALFGADRLVAFDVFRVENGRVAEHWDNLTPVTPPNPSGRTQVDGPTAVADLPLTAVNKALVADFVQTVLVAGQVGEVARFLSTETYHQHNSAIADGLDGLGAALQAMAAQGVTMVYDTLHLVVAEGNFVFTMSEGRFAGQHVAFHDLFRVADGQIVEHWDVIAEIPATMAHANGKFGTVRG